MARARDDVARGEALGTCAGADGLDGIADGRVHAEHEDARVRIHLPNLTDGVDPAAALDVLRTSAAQSRVMDVKGRKMLDGDFSVQARLTQHRKDVDIILGEGAKAGLPLPLSSLHVELLRKAEAEGWGTLDNSSIARLWGVGKP